MARAFRSWFWAQVDSGKVDTYVWAYYITLFGWGVLATFFVAPIHVIDQVMGLAVYNYWAWMNVIGTLCVLIGMSLPGGRGGYIGLWMAMGGHTCMGLVLFAFEYSAIVATMPLPLQHGDSLMVFIIFALAPYVLGCFFLSLQAGRKLWKIEKLKSHVREGIS